MMGKGLPLKSEKLGK